MRLLFREGLALSEWIMKQQRWTVTRRQAGHPAAERRWERAYQLLLSATAAGPGVPGTGTPMTTPEENHHASSRLRPGIDSAPSPGTNN